MNAVPRAVDLVLDDVHAIRRYAREGDPRAFEVLVQRYQGMVLATCRRVMHCEADAEDAVQETFLKLARSAGQIRSNIGAWLHACALGTARDLLRTRGSRARREQAVTARGEPLTDESSWADVQALLDDALAQLHEDDRELIIARFLLGRAQIDMASAAGISPGSMHRRIDRALERLRGHLMSSGLTLGAVAVVMSLDRAAQAASVSAQLTGSLMKVGLAGMAHQGSVHAGLSLAGKVVIGVLGLTLCAGGVWVATSGGSGLSREVGVPSRVAAGLAINGGAPARPTTATAPMRNLASTLDGVPDGRFTSDGRTMTMENLRDPSGHPKTLVMRVEEVAQASAPMTLTVRIVSCDVTDQNPFAALIGKTMPMQVIVSDEQVILRPMLPDMPAPPPGAPGWVGVKAEPSAALPVVVAAQDALEMVPVGRWDGIAVQQLVLAPDEVAMYQDGNLAARYRILEWTDGVGYAKLQVICVDHGDARWIGKRMKILLRESETTYALSMYDVESKQVNQWPPGFEAKKGQRLFISTWQKGAQ